MSPIQHYPVRAGKLYAGEYPGSKTPEEAASKLVFLTTLGIRTFIDLTEPRDGLAPYHHMLGPEITYHNFRIPDGGLPRTREFMRGILDAINEAIANKRPVYVHCWGGIGRTGTVVGCWLAENGLGKAAAAHVQQLYSDMMPKAARMPNSPETPAQRQYVVDWSHYLTAENPS